METRVVELTLTVPCEATQEQIEEWVEFSLGIRGGISQENPLHEYDLTADTCMVSR